VGRDEFVMMTRQGTILLAEDEANDVFFMRRAFAKTNLINPVRAVSDGHEAVSYLMRQGLFQNPDEHPLPILILLDLKLPKQNGLEVLAWIRKQAPPISRIPVVMLTSSKQSNDVNRAYELGANSYLVKPDTFDGLLGMVKALEMYWFVMNIHPEIDTENPQLSADNGTVSSGTIN
jgi:CheY-like chemotaxis protein